MAIAALLPRHVRGELWGCRDEPWSVAGHALLSCTARSEAPGDHYALVWFSAVLRCSWLGLVVQGVDI